MVSSATGSIRTRPINRRCGVKPGQGGLQSMEVQFHTGQLKIWCSPLQDSSRRAAPSSTTWTSGAFIATSYDYDAPVDEYGMMDCFTGAQTSALLTLLRSMPSLSFN